MARWIATIAVWLGALLWSVVAFAADYVLVLRDGKRLEVRADYRIVGDVAVFTTSDGQRVSIALANIDIAATERVNGQGDGEFRANAGLPKVIGASDTVAPLAAPSPAAAPRSAAPVAARKPTRTLTNADFGGSLRNAPMPRSRSTAVSNPAERPSDAPPAPLGQSGDEAYWRGRARAILVEVYAQQEIIRLLSGQEQALEQKISAQGTTTYLLGWDAFGNRVILPQEVLTAEKQELISVRDRIRDAQARLTGLYVQYTVLQEEARRLGIPPGWLR
ncbi:MAG: hypothetical protein CFK52_02450 [Chloracidobacterium sp. CP2_5A]|nr:MAG: hypothetical protein CFK52_02450 [Chloracidobacterium sp. CP2_5A]